MTRVCPTATIASIPAKGSIARSALWETEPGASSALTAKRTTVPSQIHEYSPIPSSGESVGILFPTGATIVMARLTCHGNLPASRVERYAEEHHSAFKVEAPGVAELEKSGYYVDLIDQNGPEKRAQKRASSA